MDPARLLAAARPGYADALERFAQLMESVPDTSIAIPDSEWTVRDAAAHLAGSTQRMAALAESGVSSVPTVDKEFLAARARRLIADIPEADPRKLAGQIREALGPVMAASARRSADQPITFHGGVRINLAELFGVYLGEYLLHGYDVAMAVGAPWPIDPGHAALAVAGLQPCYPAMYNPADADGLEATFRLDIAGTDPFVVRVTGQTCEVPTNGDSADCVISADAVTALLVLSGRLSQWAAIALGRLTFSGDRPDMGPRFTNLFVFP